MKSYRNQTELKYKCMNQLEIHKKSNRNHIETTNEYMKMKQKSKRNIRKQIGIKYKSNRNSRHKIEIKQKSNVNQIEIKQKSNRNLI